MPRRTYDVPFVAGVDESKDPRVLAPPQLVQATNFRVKNAETGMLAKRRGTAAIASNAVDTGSPTPVGPVRLSEHDGQLLVVGQRSAWYWSESDDQLEELDDVTSITLTDTTSLGHYTSKDAVGCAAATITNFSVWAWVTEDHVGTTYTVHVLTVDNTTGSAQAGSVVRSATSGVARTIKAIGVNDTKISVFWGESDGTDDLFVLDVTTSTFGPFTAASPPSITTLISDDCSNNTSQWFDVVPHGSGYLLAYHNDAGSITVTRYNASHASQATDDITFTGADPRVQVCGDMTTDASVTCALVIASSTNIKVARLNDSIATQGTPYDLAYSASSVYDNTGYQGIAATTVIGVTGSHDGVSLVGNVTDASSDVSMQHLIYFNDGLLGNAGGSGGMADAHVVAKPWVYDDGVYVPIRFYTSLENSHIAIVRFKPEIGTQRASNYGVMEMRALGSQAADANPHDVSGNVAVSGATVMVPFLRSDRFNSPIIGTDPTGTTTVLESGGSAVGTQVINVTGVDGYTVKHDQRDRFQLAKLGPYTFLGGGTVLTFDGRRLFELGFWSFPDISSSSFTPSTSGGSMADGTYRYTAMWEWPDYAGNVHRSSYVTTATATISGGGGSGSVAFALPDGLSQTMKQFRIATGVYGDGRPVVLAIYRSVEGETTLHRLEGTGVTGFPESSMDAFEGLGTYTDTFNSTTIDLVSRELIYADGGEGELPNEAPPPARVLTVHDARLWGVDDTDRSVVWYTKQFYPGAAPAWNRSLVVQFPADVEAITGQDGNFVAFTRHAIYTVVGRGFDNTGQLTGYEPPQLLSGERGCVNARSIVAAPPGTFFESHRGIELLPRGGGSPSHIGENVERTLETYPVITDALHVARDSEVWFSCVTAETVGATGVVVVYDYENNVWFVRDYQSKPIAAMTVHQDVVVLGIYDSASALTLWREDTGFDDADGSFISRTLELGDTRVGGVMGYQDVGYATVLGEAFGSEVLDMTDSVDSGQTYPDGTTFQAAASEPNFQRRYQTKNRKGSAHRFKLVFSQLGTTVDTEGIGIVGMTLEASPLRGAARLPAHQQG